MVLLHPGYWKSIPSLVLKERVVRGEAGWRRGGRTSQPRRDSPQVSQVSQQRPEFFRSVLATPSTLPECLSTFSALTECSRNSLSSNRVSPTPFCFRAEKEPGNNGHNDQTLKTAFRRAPKQVSLIRTMENGNVFEAPHVMVPKTTTTSVMIVLQHPTRVQENQ